MLSIYVAYKSWIIDSCYNTPFTHLLIFSFFLWYISLPFSFIPSSFYPSLLFPLSPTYMFPFFPFFYLFYNYSSSLILAFLNFPTFLSSPSFSTTPHPPLPLCPIPFPLIQTHLLFFHVGFQLVLFLDPFVFHLQGLY